MIEFTVVLPSMNGVEVSPGVELIGEPSIIEGTNKMVCLANVRGCLVKVELSVKFGIRKDQPIDSRRNEQ